MSDIGSNGKNPTQPEAALPPNGIPCPHCAATWDERGRHDDQGYCEVCNGEPGHLAHIWRLSCIIAHYIHGRTKDSERYSEAEIHLEADRIVACFGLPPIPSGWVVE